MPIIHKVPKMWGRELWHHNDSDYCMKTLVIHSGAQSSLHYHKVKRETFLCVQGSVMLEIGGDAHVLTRGDSITIEPGVAHRFRAVTDAATVIEASTTHDDADVYRVEDSKVLPL